MDIMYLLRTSYFFVSIPTEINANFDAMNTKRHHEVSKVFQVW